MSTLADVTILVTSFLRPGCLIECLNGITKHVPECQVLIVDDSGTDHNAECFSDGRETLIRLPFDSGLSAKRNAGVRACHTKYLLLACDDFLFDEQARAGIEKMVEWMDIPTWPKPIDLVGGRVDGRPYEAYLEYAPGEYIKETSARMPYEGATDCDLTVNYFLARTETLKQFPWPEEMKIGGEHVCLFLDLKLAGKRVAYVHGANIKTQPYDPSKQDPRYPEFRARARSLGHELMKKRYGIQRYIGMAGDIS